jgi:hypothetical protein
MPNLVSFHSTHVCIKLRGHPGRAHHSECFALGSGEDGWYARRDDGRRMLQSPPGADFLFHPHRARKLAFDDRSVRLQRLARFVSSPSDRRGLGHVPRAARVRGRCVGVPIDLSRLLGRALLPSELRLLGVQLRRAMPDGPAFLYVGAVRRVRLERELPARSTGLLPRAGHRQMGLHGQSAAGPLLKLFGHHFRSRPAICS